MSSGISIPGVSDKYGTNSIVDALMKSERLPLEREQNTLETYKKQQAAWRDVNTKMAALRTNVKTLYSFENPFNNKLASSTDEDAITVDADRDADYGSFKIDVVHPATADRFLSGNLEKNTTVPEGKYTFQVGEKTIDMNWKGGKLSEFVTALNKRGGNTIKANLIGISPTKQALLIESLVPGTTNRLVFKNAALDFASSIDMIQKTDVATTPVSVSSSSMKNAGTSDTVAQEGMPKISRSNVTTDGNNITIDPRGGFELAIPDEIKNNPNAVLEFDFTTAKTQDITEGINKKNNGPVLPDSGFLDFNGISISNNPDETSYQVKESEQIPTNLTPIDDKTFLFVKNTYGIEVPVEDSAFSTDIETGSTKATIKMGDYPGAESLIVRNSSTGKQISMTAPISYDASTALGFEPKHAIATADDAVIKYEGITITRSTNDIDDVVPHITLHLHEATEKTATVTIKPDKESAKDAIINFVGTYNTLIGQLNILTSNKPEIITELDYLTDSEVEKATEQLGMFMGEFSLTNERSSLQRIVSGSYKFMDDTTISMLSQIGVSTNASSGNSGYSAAQMRGYLEIDEKKLDAALENDLNQIKNIFGYDTDGDLIIDNGIGYMLDQRLASWVSTGGILSTKNSLLSSKIDTSNKKIASLEEQLDKKESELKAKYSNMQGTLNSLESQQNSIENFSKQNQGNN